MPGGPPPPVTVRPGSLETLDAGRAPGAAPGRKEVHTMLLARWLAGLTTLVGIVLALTPWFLSFTQDHVAVLDTAIGGIVVAVLGISLFYQTTAPAPPHLGPR
jgi:hypothetical protein